MSLRDIKVPAENGGTLFIPPLEEYGGLLAENRGRNRETMIGGEPLETLAAEARRFALLEGERFTRGMGLDPGGGRDPSGPVIASGHQPQMFHPGVAVKSMALAREAERLKAAAIFISVDSDEFKGEAVPALAAGDGFGKTEAVIFPQGGNAVCEAAGAEPAQGLMERLGAYRSLFNDPRLAVPARAMDGFLERLKAHDLEGKSLTERAVIMRRAWEGPVADGFLELPVSVLCRSRPFHVFAEDIIRRLDGFHAIYNSELAAYRRERKLRYPANPFPDLGEGETPFWILAGGARERLFAREGGDKAPISGETGAEASLENIKNGVIQIRPRAIVLSMFLRLFVCDLFIHGVGGAKYDTITDPIIERFYGIEPPRYAAASATLWLDVAAGDPTERIDETRRMIRDLEQHPERMAGEGAEEIARLAEEKAALVSRIREPGADKKEIGAKISGLNAAMSAILAPRKKTLEESLERLVKEQAEWSAARARDYPFFLFTPEDVYKLLGS